MTASGSIWMAAHLDGQAAAAIILAGDRGSHAIVASAPAVNVCLDVVLALMLRKEGLHMVGWISKSPAAAQDRYSPALMLLLPQCCSCVTSLTRADSPEVDQIRQSSGSRLYTLRQHKQCCMAPNTCCCHR